jgi:hypothetical protein
MSRIPNIFHFVYIKERPWKLHHFLSVKSAVARSGADKVVIWCDEEPEGEYWEKTKPLVEVQLVKAPTEIFGIPITQPAHKSDVIRLQVLIEHGGIYADTDVIVVKPFTDLLDNQFVMGQQGLAGSEGLCPATMLGAKGSVFAKTWLAGFKDTFGGGPPGSPTWCTHSVNLPAYLANTMQENISIADHEAFFWPLYHEDGVRNIFETPNYQAPNAYSIHLWESSGKKYLNEMTEEKIRKGNSLFSSITKDLLDD